MSEHLRAEATGSAPSFAVGDRVRENWSGIVGEIVSIDGDEARVQWPSRVLPTRLSWLVHARTPADGE